MPYIDYDYYSETYGGTKVSAAEFPRLSQIASIYVDMATSGRIKDNVIDNVKMATCAVMDEYKNQETPEIASKSVGKQSESYVVSEKMKNDRLYEALYPWLINTGLLYKGVDPYVYS